MTTVMDVFSGLSEKDQDEFIGTWNRVHESLCNFVGGAHTFRQLNRGCHNILVDEVSRFYAEHSAEETRALLVSILCSHAIIKDEVDPAVQLDPYYFTEQEIDMSRELKEEFPFELTLRAKREEIAEMWRFPYGNLGLTPSEIGYGSDFDEFWSNLEIDEIPYYPGIELVKVKTAFDYKDFANDPVLTYKFGPGPCLEQLWESII